MTHRAVLRQQRLSAPLQGLAVLREGWRQVHRCNGERCERREKDRSRAHRGPHSIGGGWAIASRTRSNSALPRNGFSRIGMGAFAARPRQNTVGLVGVKIMGAVIWRFLMAPARSLPLTPR